MKKTLKYSVFEHINSKKDDLNQKKSKKIAVKYITAFGRANQESYKKQYLIAFR